MALPAKPKKTIQRVSAAYTVGNPELTPETSTISTAPNIGSARNNPPALTFLGTDVSTFSIPVGALSGGATATLTQVIGFGNLPTPLQVGSADLAQFVVNIAALLPGLVTLVPIAFTVTPLAAMRGGGVCRVPVLAPGNIYTAFSALVTVTLWATANTAATTVTGQVQAVLTDQLN